MMSDCKVMMIRVFHQNPTSAYQVLSKNTNADFEVYLEFPSRVILPAIKQLWIHRPPRLHDNVTPHRHWKVKDFFVRYGWEQLKRPPYNPNLNRYDYDGIYKIKRPNKDKTFNTPDELEGAYKQVIDYINLNGSATGTGYLPLRWALVNQTERGYIH